MNVLAQVRSRVGLEEGEQVLEGILLEIYVQPGISTKALSRKSFLPVPVVAASKKEFIKAGILSKRQGISLTSEGTAFVEETLGFHGIEKALYSRLMNDGWTLEEEFEQELMWLHEIFEQRPQVDVTLDQSQCTPETSLRRAMFCLQRRALIGKQVVCVGDDDLVSVSIGMVLQRLFPERPDRTSVHVLDIDQRFLTYIQEIAATYSFPIHCHAVDLRQPLPESLQGRCDAVFTDPPYTLPGFQLFVSRGIAGLKPNVGLPIFLSFAHKPPEFMLHLQRETAQMGLVMAEMIPAFNGYEGAEIIGNTSQMILLRTTAQTTPLITGEFQDPFYTGELRQTVREYQCKQCREVVRVGAQEAYPTIEALKRQGCPRCQQTTFDLVNRKISQKIEH